MGERQPHGRKHKYMQIQTAINLLEYPIPAAAPTAPSVTKTVTWRYLGITKCGIIDPLISKRPENIPKKTPKNQNKRKKIRKKPKKLHKKNHFFFKSRK